MDQCLALRQQLKETFRAKLREQAGGATTTSGRKENAAPTDNYGNFFGHSEIIFTGKAIQETKLWSQKFLKEVVRKKLINNNGDKKSDPRSKMEKVILDPIFKQTKVEWLKETRDYSFLSSDCDQIPVPGNKSTNSRFPDEILKKENKAKNSRFREIQGVDDTTTENKTKNSRFSEIQGNKGVKTSWPEKKQVSRVLGKPLEKRKELIDSRKELKPVNKKEPKKNPNLKSVGRKRKLEQRDAEENEKMKAISIIRKMYGYDPTKFCDDKEDLNMESTFADIQKEERRSAKIAKKEDDEEELLQKKLRNSKKLIKN